MPESRIRRKAAYTPPPVKSARKRRSAPWVAPAMLVFFALGLAWLVTYYVAGQSVPGMSALNNWNLLIGFGLIVAGFGFATQWR